MIFEISFILSLVNLILVNGIWEVDFETKYPAFDPQFYESVLDSELCSEQLEYISSSNSLLRFNFLDAGLRIPKGILKGSTDDFGNYYQCLEINHEDDGMHIEGKYCTASVVFSSQTGLKELFDKVSLGMFDPVTLQITNDTRNKANMFQQIMRNFNDMPPSRSGDIDLSGVSYRLSVCIPKPCTTQEGLSGLFNSTAVGSLFNEESCRLPNDKPWVPVDYVAIVIFSLFGLLTILSTSYDLWNTFKLKKDPKSINSNLTTFSIYTNARRLTTFTSNPKALDCIDGIRCLSITWVILGHTFSTFRIVVNPIEGLDFMTSFQAQWLMMTHVGVDTFFTISGLLLVYTSVGKLTGSKLSHNFFLGGSLSLCLLACLLKEKLLKNLHVFYLNRVLRMFPLLATTILLQASILHRVADGPRWEAVAQNTDNCRTHWWLSLLYVQNYINAMGACLGHSWYLAVDTQLYFISPVILYWVLNGRRKTAWIALTTGLLTCMTAATIYCFVKNMTGTLSLPYFPGNLEYRLYFYFNTLTRASPFFVGMVFGYLLHEYRGKKMHINKFLVLLLWVVVIGLTTAAITVTYPMMSVDYDNQLLNNFVNSFQRPLWGLAVCMIIFGCVQGYGGPINWMLSHPIWKLPSRISYGMYLLHYPIQFVISGSELTPVYFSLANGIYRFFSQWVIAFLVSFALTLLIDSPFSTIVKLVLSPETKKPPPKIESINQDKEKFNTEEPTTEL